MKERIDSFKLHSPAPVKSAHRLLRKFRDQLNADEYRPQIFLCRDCKIDWHRWDGGIGCDLAKVSCSNCYGDNVVVTHVELIWSDFTPTAVSK